MCAKLITRDFPHHAGMPSTRSRTDLLGWTCGDFSRRLMMKATQQPCRRSPCCAPRPRCSWPRYFPSQDILAYSARTTTARREPLGVDNPIQSVKHYVSPSGSASLNVFAVSFQYLGEICLSCCSGRRRYGWLWASPATGAGESDALPVPEAEAEPHRRSNDDLFLLSPRPASLDASRVDRRG